jgi:6-pyruvoyltetrahydropterin/6-carboxytetrahydropterin synthase
MPELHLTRKEHFNAAHRLWNKDWSEEKNYSVFGKCANPHFHGHNFELFVTVKGQPDPGTGCVINLKELKEIIRRKICLEMDHKNLNIEVDWLADCIPSIENMTVRIWQRIAEELPPGVALHKVTLWETENNYVEYYGL